MQKKKTLQLDVIEFFRFVKTYFSLIADTGQVPMHEWQSIHVASSHCDFPSPSRDRAVQAPHPMQTSLSTVTGMFNFLLLQQLQHDSLILQSSESETYVKNFIFYTTQLQLVQLHFFQQDDHWLMPNLEHNHHMLHMLCQIR